MKIMSFLKEEFQLYQAGNEERQNYNGIYLGYFK
jgi:hypothetical protein